MQGAVLCARFCGDSPYALAVGGTKNGFQTIDIRVLESGIDGANSAGVVVNSLCPPLTLHRLFTLYRLKCGRNSCLTITISSSFSSY